MNKKERILDFSGVEETALLTLYARAHESRSKDPILKDLRAEQISVQLDQVLRDRNSPMAQQLYNKTIDPRLVVHIPLRSKKYDELTREFLDRHPAGIIVSIGCGMDTRFFRIDNEKCHFFDIDLPEMIKFKKQLVEETDRYKMIGQSVLDTEWMDKIEILNKPVLFLAEGLFMYLTEENVKSLVLEMQRRFPGSELVCELTNREWVSGFWGRVASMKMQKQIKMGADAGFKFGVSDAQEIEKWHEGIKFMEQWFYMDSNHPKLGWMRIFRNLKFFRNAQFTAHYLLN